MRTAPTRLLTILAVASLSAAGCGDEKDPATDATTADGETTNTPDGETTNQPDTETTSPDGDVNEVGPETETEVEAQGCGLRECGTFGALNCGDCDDKPGTECNDNGRCVVPGGALGAFCGITSTCVAGDADYPACLDEQCETGLCNSATVPGYPFTLLRDWGEAVSPNSFCTATCLIYADDDNDGVNDADQQDDCNPIGVVNGPVGNTFRCVNFAGIDDNPLGFCMPGSDFEVCTSDSECPAGEGCEFTTFGGDIEGSSRCVAKYRAGTWGELAGSGEACNRDPAEGPVALCETGYCYGGATGCSITCATNDDCATAEAKCTNGSCEGKPGTVCVEDGDCGGLECSPLFSDIAFTSCQAKACDDEFGCGPGFFCDFFWNQSILNPGVIQECARVAEDGVDFGEACDPDPTDAEIVNEGAVCKSNLCIGEQCSALCTSSDQCGDNGVCYNYEDELNFIACEIAADCGAGNGCTAGEDGDGACYDLEELTYIQGEETIGVLAYNFCIFYDDASSSCAVDADCGAEERCDTYQTRRFVEGVLDADAPVITEGICVPNAGDKEYGEECTAGDECKDGFCFPVTDSFGYCSRSCATSDECGSFDLGEDPVNGFCRSFVWSYAGDLDNTNNFNFLGLCLYETGSRADCSADFTCELATEACYPNTIAGQDPTKPGSVEFFCSQFWETAEERGTKQLGADCDPNAELVECDSGICWPSNDEATEGYCSAPCSPDGEACDGGLDCTEQIDFPRTGAYVANGARFHMCLKP